MEKLKLTVGINDSEDYLRVIDAGADEVYCGYVNADFYKTADDMVLHSVNRREVIYSNTQIGSEGELLILRKMAEQQKRPVVITFNSPHYSEDIRKRVLGLIRNCIDMGFNRFIVADYELIKELTADKSTSIEVYVSGEFGELNSMGVSSLINMGVKRIIFPRQTMISEMKSIISESRKYRSDVEFEAFALNEKCHFTGAYCRTFHCDGFQPMCRVPYCLKKVNFGENEACEEMETAGCTEDVNYSEPVIGASGCGLCSLWALREAGITHIKLVSRGNFGDLTVKNTLALKRAAILLEASDCKEAYIANIRKELFENGCSNNCLYRE